jgi:hypothetical protein
MKKRGIEIKINLSNRAIYTLIVIGILAIVGVGVYAYGTSNPSNFGHSFGELTLPSCSNGQVLGMSGGSWGCVDMASGGGDFNGWSFANDVLLDNNEQVIKTSDEWLRLNQEGHFKNGIYTPGKLRAEGGIYVGDDESFYRSAEDVIKTDDSFLFNLGSTRIGSSCSESQWGQMKGCVNTNGQPSNSVPICICIKYADSGWHFRWEMITTED